MKSLISLLLGAVLSSSLYASDLVVDPLAPAGSGIYSSINAALADATAGDRIIVVTENGPVMETVSINKTIEIVPATLGERWKLQGNILINGSGGLSGGSIIRISGLEQLIGGFSVPNALSTAGATLSLADSKINNGSLSLDANYLRCELLHDSVMNGQIQISSGIVAGCYVRSTTNSMSLINVPQRSVQTSADPITYVVGNDVEAQASSQTAIYWASASTNPYIANNVIKLNGGFNYGIFLADSPPTGYVEVLNNTIAQVSWYQGIYLSYVRCTTRIFSNMIQGTTQYAIYISPSYTTNPTFATLSYNHAQGHQSVAFNAVDDGTNVLHAAGVNTIDLVTGGVVGPAEDGGHPNAAYRDLDDTQNDPGAMGGSYARANFTNASGSAVTAFVIAPTRVVAGQSIDVRAFGFAR